ncbi:DUF3224 domain-containing protein [Bowmanella dokdonensis]|uniref:DUF3224 domain-containing protein n=1 Tax=Bowmanella dokdonensis TaxID=751969 RepID=A0A939INX1_9ALTE|nr:DUF3224 domain-containing protein [Bowmanella dokdonensis]MBN7826813.1 DUF3224 domain-containing protein [Bowmanella dokdonensis]
MQAKGEFQVNLKPMGCYAKGQNGINLGRMAIDKTFAGELSGTSKGEMLSAMTQSKGSAGYVAIEQVSGELAGRQGSFVLQHYGTMHQANQHLILEVVPASGTDELLGLTGSMSIRIENGRHFYQFDYQLPPEQG